MNPQKITNLVKYTAHQIGGEFNITSGGVPRIIYKGKDISFSIVYIARINKWKIFFPFPAEHDEQKKEYFEDIEKLKSFLLVQ